MYLIAVSPLPSLRDDDGVDLSWQDPSAAWWAKARRARKHIVDFGVLLAAFDPGSAYRLYRETVGAETALRFRVLWPVPSELLTTIGDALRNMRSCLDSVAVELARRTLGDEMTEDSGRQYSSRCAPTARSSTTSSRRKTSVTSTAGTSGRRCARPLAIREEAHA